MPAQQHHRKQGNENDGDKQPKPHRTQDNRQNSTMETSKAREKHLWFEAEHKKLANTYLTAHGSYTIGMKELLRRAKNVLYNAMESYNAAILKIVKQRLSNSNKVQEYAKPVLKKIERAIEAEISKAQTMAEVGRIKQKGSSQRNRALKNVLESLVTMKEFKEASNTPEANACKFKIGNRLAEQRNEISEEVEKLQETFKGIILEILDKQRELRDEMDKETIGDRMLAELDLLEKDRRKRKDESDHALASAQDYLNKDLFKLALEVQCSKAEKNARRWRNDC